MKSTGRAWLEEGAGHLESEQEDWEDNRRRKLKAKCVEMMLHSAPGLHVCRRLGPAEESVQWHKPAAPRMFRDVAGVVLNYPERSQVVGVVKHDATIHSLHPALPLTSALVQRVRATAPHAVSEEDLHSTFLAHQPSVAVSRSSSSRSRREQQHQQQQAVSNDSESGHPIVSPPPTLDLTPALADGTLPVVTPATETDAQQLEKQVHAAPLFPDSDRMHLLEEIQIAKKQRDERQLERENERERLAETKERMEQERQEAEYQRHQLEHEHLLEEQRLVSEQQERELAEHKRLQHEQLQQQLAEDERQHIELEQRKSKDEQMNSSRRHDQEFEAAQVRTAQHRQQEAHAAEEQQRHTTALSMAHIEEQRRAEQQLAAETQRELESRHRAQQEDMRLREQQLILDHKYQAQMSQQAEADHLHHMLLKQQHNLARDPETSTLAEEPAYEQHLVLNGDDFIPVIQKKEDTPMVQAAESLRRDVQAASQNRKMGKGKKKSKGGYVNPKRWNFSTHA